MVIAIARRHRWISTISSWCGSCPHFRAKFLVNSSRKTEARYEKKTKMFKNCRINFNEIYYLFSPLIDRFKVECPKKRSKIDVIDYLFVFLFDANPFKLLHFLLFFFLLALYLWQQFIVFHRKFLVILLINLFENNNRKTTSNTWKTNNR